MDLQTILETLKSRLKNVPNKLPSLEVVGKVTGCVIAVEVFRRIVNKIYYEQICKQPPGPVGWPLIGSLTPIISSPASFFRECSDQYGPIMSVNFALQRNIVVNDKQLYKALCAQDKGLGVTKPHMNYLDQAFKEPSLDLVNGEQWVLRRKLVMTSFMSLANSSFVSDTCDFSMENISNKLDSKANELWFPRQDIKYIVTNVAFKALYGSALSSDNKLFSRLFEINAALFEQVTPILLFDFFRINFLPNWFVKKYCIGAFDQSVKDLFTSIETWMIEEGGFEIDRENESIRRKKKGNDEQHSYYIDTVIDYLEKNKNSLPISYYSLIFDLNVILSAAADTTAHALEYALCLLCKHENIQTMVYEQIKEILNKHKLDTFNMSVVNECVYLRAFVYETLRISTVVPLNPHCNEQDINIDYDGKSYFIPKKSMIMINAGYIHYNGSFNRSMDINLKNWIDDKGQFKMNPDFILFGIGKRNCVGQTLAMRELYYVLASLLLKYKMVVKDEEERKKLDKMKQKWDAITQLDPEIGINLEKRK